MNPDFVHKISQEIYRRFPEVKGSHPKVLRQNTAQAKSIPATNTYLITFQGKVSMADQHSMPRWVRVVADDEGKILKITTSR